jgi:hypothetical protein
MVQQFLSQRPVTYAILNKSSFKYLQRMGEGTFNVTLLQTVGDEYVVKVEKHADKGRSL